ncbi:MAG: hypothetical protein ABIR26_00090, partial [Ramlibacter sp.]
MRTLTCVLALVAFLPACASMNGNEMQQLSLSTKGEDGVALDGVKCKLQNDRGSWEASSPGVVHVRRSSEDLHVECSKDGSKGGLLKAVSRASDSMMGNAIMPGGTIGAIIDHNTGMGYDYPEQLSVQM